MANITSGLPKLTDKLTVILKPSEPAPTLAVTEILDVNDDTVSSFVEDVTGLVFRPQPNTYYTFRTDEPGQLVKVVEILTINVKEVISKTVPYKVI